MGQQTGQSGASGDDLPHNSIPAVSDNVFQVSVVFKTVLAQHAVTAGSVTESQVPCG